MEGYFYALLEEQMQRQSVSEEKLSEGICSPSLVSRVRRGERMPNKMMRDRLTGRLGISGERNENFLFYDDYIKWRKRRAILDCVERRETDKARKLLAEYAKAEGFANSIEQQFCHAMEAQLMMYENAGNAELADRLETAVKLTVPCVDEKTVADLQLSVQELNLILEYEKYRHPVRLMQRCDEILRYIDQSAFDNEAKAKIYPKVVWYQCETLSKEPDMDCRKIIKYSNQGIQYLRAVKKTYYLWELLSVREDAFEVLSGRLLSNGEAKKADALCQMSRENRRWKLAVETVYGRCGLSPQMENFCYLYMQQEVYCINEVIRCRRKMLGMTRKQLGEGICDEQTIMRLENNGSKMQMPLVKLLFEKLKLSGEIQRADIVAGSKKALDLLEQLVEYAGNFDFDNQEKVLKELEMHLNMDIPLNQQFVKKDKAIQLWGGDRKNNDKAFQMMKEALECTISLEAIRESDEIYLTNSEAGCLRNMAVFAGNNEITPYWVILQKICEEYEAKGLTEERASQYEWFTTSIACVLGNAGMYDESDACAQKVILLNAHSHRVSMVAQNLERLSWNNMQRQKTGIPLHGTYNRAAELECRLALCRFCKAFYYEKRYRGEWEELPAAAPNVQERFLLPAFAPPGTTAPGC